MQSNRQSSVERRDSDGPIVSPPVLVVEKRHRGFKLLGGYGRSMTWIRTIDEEDAEGELESVYARVRASRGKVADIFKAQSLFPSSLQAHLELYLSLMFGGGGLTRRQREIIAVVVSSVNHCEYCVEHHSTALRKYARDEAFVTQLGDNPDSVSLGPKEKAMVDHAVALTRDPGSLTEAHIEALRGKGMNDEEILQLTLIASYFNFVNRIASGLGVNLEEGQVSYKY